MLIGIKRIILPPHKACIFSAHLLLNVIDLTKKSNRKPHPAKDAADRAQAAESAGMRQRLCRRLPLRQRAKDRAGANRQCAPHV